MKYTIDGKTFQTLHVTLNSDESFYAERKALVARDAHTDFAALGNGKSFFSIISARLSGESIFLKRFDNRSSSTSRIVLSGKANSIQPVVLDENQPFILWRGSCLTSDTQMKIGLHISLNKMLKGTEPAFQSIRGNGTLFFTTVDRPVKITLQSGQEIVVDENRVTALYGIPDSRINLQRKFNIFRNMFVGEGLFMTRITGPGTVYLSTVAPQYGNYYNSFKSR